MTRMNTVPEVNEADLKCPTCGHPYDYDVIDEIIRKTQEEHRKRHSTMLADNAPKIEENKRAGKANNEVKAKYQAILEEISAGIETKRKRLAEIEQMPLYINEPIQPDTSKVIDNDTMIAGYNDEIATIEDEIKKLSSTSEDTEKKALETEISLLSSKIEDIAVRLSKRTAIERNIARIEELENELRAKNNELAELEGIEFTMQEFSKARTEAVESKINSLFTLVKFKMFDTQINGAEVEACEATVDGVPFSDLNDAGRINAGLDIINAICKFEGVYAPLFIDNAESNNHIKPVNSQLITLRVTRDPQFVITSSDDNPNISFN